jgi:hypothetical protein
MESKVCTKCGEEKALCDFYKRLNQTTAQCKECIKSNMRDKYKENPSKDIEYSRNYRKANPLKGREDAKKWREANPDRDKENKAKWLAKNPDYEKERSKRRRKETPHIFAWRDMLKDSLKRLGKKKEGHTIDLLGYSALELKEHIESLFTEGMTWDNHGEWHIDHIKPVSTFDPETPSSVVNALSNLQPLWSTTREVNGVIHIGNLNKGKQLIH